MKIHNQKCYSNEFNDNNGNLLSKGSDSYTWDYRNRIASSTSNSITTSYQYDHTNQRILKTTGSNVTKYINQYYDIENSTTTKYIYANGELVASITGSGGSAQTSYIHPDYLGSTNIVTNDTGSLTQTLDYYPYGSKRIESGTDTSHKEFIGQYFDEDTDLSYLNARYYEGVRGQFLSQDPVFWELGATKDGKMALEHPQAQNSYSYAGGNPITFKDPSGRWYKEFVTGNQSWGSFQLELNAAANQLSQDSSGWKFAMDHPVATGAIIAVASIPALESGSAGGLCV